MSLVEVAGIADGVQISSEYLYLTGDAGLQDSLPLSLPDETGMREIAEDALALMGLNDVLHPGNGPGDTILKNHETVRVRDAAVAEQFFHADVAVDGFCGILLVGIEGDDPDLVPETHTVNNASMLDNIVRFVGDTALQDRLDEVVVVRPYLSADRTEWMNYPRHVLTRLAESPFRELLTPDQVEHVDRESDLVVDRTRYDGDVFVSELMSESVIDGRPMPTCGVGSREIRLAFNGVQTEEDTNALALLHRKITCYLLGASVQFEAQKVVAGSALFIPTNQLHRATPYDPAHHKRSVAAVKCYPEKTQLAPASWKLAAGTLY